MAKGSQSLKDHGEDLDLFLEAWRSQWKDLSIGAKSE